MESASEYQSIVRWLSSPEAYHPSPERVERIETHISNVFLAGALVYKLKKPVAYSFLDFSTPAARKRACCEEVRLNRRLAEQWYLGVVPVTRRADGGFEIDGAGEAVEWLVQMRRLPIERTMEALCRRGQLRPADVERLVDRLLAFQRSLSPLQPDVADYLERYETNVRANLRELQQSRDGMSESLVQRVHGFQLQLLVLHSDVLSDRVRAGRIVDGHGDLRPEHICFTDPIAIFDCIEFSADLRRIDVADELAFLAAECDFLKADWVGARLLADYQAKSGDHPPAVLFHFFKAYRACVRAKIAALRADQLAGGARDEALHQSQLHLAVADQAIRPWLKPLLIVVGGLAGTGKTTLAGGLAEKLGAHLLRTDVIRQEIFGRGSHAAQPDHGVYSPEARQKVYEELLRRAARLHSQGVSLVLDGTFATVDSLRAVQGILTGQFASAVLAVECVCRPEVAYDRIRGRLAEGSDASEARPELHDIQRVRWEKWPADIDQCQVDTERPNSEQLAHVVRKLQQCSGSQPPHVT